MATNGTLPAHTRGCPCSSTLPGRHTAPVVLCAAAATERVAAPETWPRRLRLFCTHTNQQRGVRACGWLAPMATRLWRLNKLGQRPSREASANGKEHCGGSPVTPKPFGGERHKGARITEWKGFGSTATRTVNRSSISSSSEQQGGKRVVACMWRGYGPVWSYARLSESWARPMQPGVAAAQQQEA